MAGKNESSVPPPWRRPLSIRGKLIALTVGLFVLFIWALALVSATVVRHHFDRVLAEQQFSFARHVAAELDIQLEERIRDLADAARGLPDELTPAALDHYLARQTGLHPVFTAGITILGLDGRAIADYPAVPGRRGAYYGDRAYFRQTVASWMPHIDKPIMGRTLKRPLLAIGVPVFDRSGGLRAVLAGITDLTAPNFLGLVSDPTLTGKGELSIFSRRGRIFVAATDARRVLAEIPARGADPMFDRFVEGFEGSGLGVGADGRSRLYSGKQVAVADWVVLTTLPAEAAYEPVQAMGRHLYAIAAALTLLAMLAAWWTARRVLAPLEDAGASLRAMAAGRLPLSPLPAGRQDEVGRLIGNFNLLVKDRQRYEAALADSEQRFRMLVEGAPDAIVVQTRACFAYVNTAALRLFGAEAKEQLLGTPCIARVHPERRAACEEGIRLVNHERKNIAPVEERFIRIDGTPVYAELSAVPFHYEHEDGALIFLRDVSERKQQQDRIARLGRIYKLLSGINSTIVRIHERRALLEAACRVAVEEGQFGMAWIGLLRADGESVEAHASWGIPLEVLQDLAISTGSEAPERQGTIHEALQSGRAVYCNDIAADPQMGPVRRQALAQGYASVCILPLVVDGAGIGVMGLYAREAGFFDAEEMKLLDELAADISFALQYIQREERLNYLAYYDALTGLPNRTLFRDRLTQFLHGSQEGSGSVAAILLDLDHFTHVNETHGRHVGDGALRQVAERLAAAVPEPCSLARLGADTFAVAVSGPGQGAEAAAIVQEQVFDALARPFPLPEGKLSITAHAGIALYPGDGADADSLLLSAEAALKEARSSGRRCLYYAPEINARIAANLSLERDLRVALAARQFVLHYQPRVDLLSGEMAGAEALIRWQHPERGLVPPAGFIPQAERSGLIVAIGAWVIDTVCAQQAAWLAEGLDVVPVAVNLSPVQFAHGQLLPTLEAALDKYGLAAKYLELELTESLVMQNPEAAAQTMKGFRRCGLRLSLDDFGTGYSSLAYLRRFPLDFVKIDRTFVSDITTNPGDAAIATAVIAMAHRLNLRVVAEGVETEGQLCYLRRHGCDQVQGFYFSRPVPAPIFDQLLRSTRRLGTAPAWPDAERPTLLLVDDEPGILSALHRLLRREGYRILNAGSGEEGLELLATHLVQVIVSDQRMPGMSGSEFLSIVKELHPDTIRIILSGYTDLQAVTEAVNRGAVYKFLTKPWDDELLKENIRDAFQRYRPPTPALAGTGQASGEALCAG